MKTLLAVRHVPFEDLGSLADPLRDAGYDICYLDIGIDDTAQLETLRPDLLVVLGGPIGAYEEDHYPFLRHELHSLASRLHRGLPTLGICLGAQLMARALGARVYPGPAKEIGWAPLQLTAAGAVSPIRHLGEAHCRMLHWHGDTFDLPEGATLHASTAACAHQVFSWGPHALGFQCHPEFRADRVEQWLVGHACELAAAGIDPEGIRAESRIHGEALARQAQHFLREWLVTLESRGAGMPEGAGTPEIRRP